MEDSASEQAVTLLARFTRQASGQQGSEDV